MGTVKEAEIKVIVELTDLLNKNANKVTSGETKVCLTTSSLAVLAANFRRYSEAKDRQTENAETGSSSWISKFRSRKVSIDHTKWRESIRTLYDFVIKIRSLKMILGSNTLKAPVQIARFSALTVLEVKKVPIHMVEGLSKLRGQLTEIIVTRSAQTLQVILEICGGDRSSGFVWSNLKAAHVSFNGFKHLDNSLRFIPFVEVLDLSHNNIHVTEDFLQHLTDINKINFGFNLLKSVPQFSYSNRGKLKTLVLRNNNLESLEGIQEMQLLEELDVTENCLIDHSVLHVLTSLNRLTVLYLIGNPLFYIPNHRQKTTAYISSYTRLREFSLDGQSLSAEEILVTRKNKYQRGMDQPENQVTIVQDPPSGDDPLVIPRTPTKKDRSGDQLTPSTPHSEKKKRGHRRIKSRERVAKIADMSDSYSESNIFENNSPIETSREEEMITAQIEKDKKNIELMRKHYKDDWLKALSADQGKSYPESSNVTDNNDGKQEEEKKLLNDASATGRSENRVSKVQSDDDRKENKHDSNVKIVPDVWSTQEKKEDPVVTKSVEVPPSTVDETSPEMKVSSPTAIKIEQTTDIYAFSRKESTVAELTTSIQTFDDSAEQYGEESDPFIVMLPEEDMNHLIVTVNNRYIIEKNLNGQRREALDLKFLQDIKRTEEELSGKDIIGGILFTVVRLKFDYARKDMRERRYAMEDEIFASNLEALLSSHLKREEDDLLECLKCQYQFPRAEAKSSPLPACPKCKSKMLIKVDQQSTREMMKPSQQNNESKPNASPRSSQRLQRRSAYKRSRHKQPEALSGDISQTSHSTSLGYVSNEPERSSEEGQISSGLRSNNTSWSDMQKASISARNSASSVESDITVLGSQSNKSGTIIAESSHEIIREQETMPFPNRHDLNQQEDGAYQSGLGKKTSSSASIEIQSASLKEQLEIFGWIKDKKDQLTPVGSPLSNSVCSSMVSSVYENTLPSPTENQAGDGSGDSFTSSSTDSVSVRHHSSSHGRPRSRNRNALISNLQTDELDGKQTENKDKLESSNNSVPSLNVSDSEKSVNSIYDTVSESMEWGADLSETSPNVSHKSEGQSFHSSPLTNGSSRRSAGQNSSTFSLESDNHNQHSESSTGLSDFPSDVSPIKRSGFQRSARKGKRSGIVMDAGHWPADESVFKHISEVSVDVSQNSDQASLQDISHQSQSSNKNQLPWEEDVGDKAHGGVNLDEFRNVDHRIQLYLELKVFQADEVCQCAIQCDIVQYMNNTPVRSLLVISTNRLLIFKMDGEKESDVSLDWLKCYEDQPIAELRYIDIGLGYQSLRIEFKTMCSSFTLLIADESRCKNFLALLTDIIHSIDHYKLEGISKSNPVTLKNVDKNILLREESDEEEIPGEDKQTLIRYLIVRYSDEDSETDNSTLMGLAISNTDLVLINENHQWPLPRLQAPLSDSVKKKQFSVVRREKINNIESLMFNEFNPKELRLSFFETSDANSSLVWMIAMETTSGVKSFVDAIRDPWEEEFGVSLDVTSTSFTDDSSLSKN